MVLKRVGVWSVARIAGALYASLGLFFGAIFALVSIVAGGLLPTEGPDAAPAFLGVLFGAGAVVFLPIVYGSLGMVMAAISAGLYNLLARAVGGIEIELG